MTKQFAITSIDVDLPRLGHRQLNFAEPADNQSRSTILVGRNGTGKSTILRELAMAFRAYFATSNPGSRHGRDRVNTITISANGRQATLNLKSSSKDFREERDQMSSHDLRPRRLIALSFTPFDKFPSADDTAQTERSGRPITDDPFYVYLGFKSDYRAMSPRSRLLRSIDQLAFTLSKDEAEGRVVEAFAAIGYAPLLTISYALSSVAGSKDYRRSDDPRLLSLIAEVNEHIAATSDGPRRLSHTINFQSGESDFLPVSYADIRELLRARFLRLVSVTLNSLAGEKVELLELSSGELNLLSGFLGLAAFLTDGCLVLVDEPENSLHPEWQIRYVEMLEKVVSQYRGCHYVIATHAPLIVSGVADKNTKILRLDQEPIEVPSSVVSDASPDATLLTAFEVVTPGNNFLKQLVLEAMALVEDGKHRGHRARSIATFLARTVDQIPKDDPLRALVVNIIQSILLQP